MTDKERLEEIRLEYSENVKAGLIPRISDSDIEWLIQQAERVQELEDWKVQALKVNQSEMQYRGKISSRLADSEGENKRLREALNHIQSEVMKVCPNDLLFEIYDATRKGLGEV